MKGDDPLLSKMMGEIAIVNGDDEQELEWDIDTWMGRDLHKYWIKTSGAYSFNADNGEKSDIETANLELVFSHAVSAYWDQQFGIRHDLEDAEGNSSRNWLSFGYIGTTPYFIELDTRVFIGEESSKQLLIEAEREFLLTQQWVLTSGLDLTINGHSNIQRKEGSGFSSMNNELKVGYERTRKYQPFVGITYKQMFGETRKLVKQAGSNNNEFEMMIGIEAWF
jgi:copper resistance protein B